MSETDLQRPVTWDYSELARAYLKRPDYADQAIDAMLAQMDLPAAAPVCDIGAGAAHLTLMLARRGFALTAIEPNARMRELGIERTRDLANVRWKTATGEETGEPDGAYALTCFGSSFNVCDRSLALRESARILAPGGWFACMWNHRDLSDPLQAHIEALIRQMLPDYGYGVRRQDQTDVLRNSDLFGPVQFVQGRIWHKQSRPDCLTAWRSHATLQRQAGESFGRIVEAIDALLAQAEQSSEDGLIHIPYDTRIWFARKPA